MRFFAIASVLFTTVLASIIVESQTPQFAAVILTDLRDTVTPLANLLVFVTPQNATPEDLTPVIGNISAAVMSAVDKMNLLKDQPTSVIMASVDGTTTLRPFDIATLLSDIANLIFGAAGVVLDVVDNTKRSIIYDLLAALGKVFLGLLAVVLSLVADLLAPLTLLLVPVLSIIDSLGLSSLISSILGGVL